MRPPTVSRDSALDGIRGVALIAVLVHNTGWIVGESRHIVVRAYAATAGAGWVGVQIFFVLSGYLITLILLESRERDDYYRRFFLRRTLRIFPPYYATLALTALIALTVARTSEWATTVVRNQWVFWLYISNLAEPFGASIDGLAHAWSLAVEEQFYLIWPVVVRRLSPKTLLWAVLVFIVAGPLIRVGMLAAGAHPHAIYTFPLARLDALALGALLALSRLPSDLSSTIRQSLTTVGSVAGGLSVVLVGYRHGLQAHDPVVLIVGQSLMGVLAATVIGRLVLSPLQCVQHIRRFLMGSALVCIGQRSYAMYLSHFPVHSLLSPHLISFVQTGDGVERVVRILLYSALITACSLLIAELSWRLLEQPMLRVRNRLDTKLSK